MKPSHKSPACRSDNPAVTLALPEKAAALEAIRASLAEERDLQYAYLFGSFLERGPNHDIDVAVAYANLSPRDADQRAFDLQGRLETGQRVPVDVVALNGRPVSFRYHVFRGTALVIRDEDTLVADIEQTARIYFDQEPLLRHATIEAFAR